MNLTVEDLLRGLEDEARFRHERAALLNEMTGQTTLLDRVNERASLPAPPKWVPFTSLIPGNTGENDPRPPAGNPFDDLRASHSRRERDWRYLDFLQNIQRLDPRPSDSPLRGFDYPPTL